MFIDYIVLEKGHASIRGNIKGRRVIHRLGELSVYKVALEIISSIEEKGLIGLGICC